MKKLMLAVLATFTGWCYADPPAPFPIEINSQSRVAPEVWTWRNNVRTFRATFKDGTNMVSLVGATPFMSWSTSATASAFVTSSYALVNSGTNGIVDFTFVAAALNYATITNVYEIGVAGSVAIYNQGRFLIKPSAFSTGTNTPVFTTNQNLTGYSFTGQPWIENVTLTTSGSDYVWSGTGTTRNLNVPTGTLSSAGYATGTPLYVEAFTGSVGSAAGFATGTPLYVESFTGSVGSLSGVATGSPLYVETYTGSVGSLSGVATGTPLYVETFTGSVGSAAGFATGTPLYVEAHTGNVGSLVGVATGTPLYVEAFTGSVGTIAGLATGTPLYVEAWTGSVGTIAGLATGTPLYVEAFTGSVGSLSGMATGTPIYSVAGLATGTPLYVDQFTGSVGSVSGLATGTPVYAEADATAMAAILNYVSKTSTVEQVMVSSLQSYGTLSAVTNLTAANTNSVGGEKLSNGTFTGSEANWSLTGCTYNANNLIVLQGATATITYTAALASVKGKALLVSWLSTPANGLDFTTYKVSVGGVTNNIGTCPTSTVAKLFGPLFTDQPLQFVVAPGTNQLILDTVSMKEDTDGDLIVADDASVGGRLAVGESIATTGSVTAGSFSGGVATLTSSLLFPSENSPIRMNGRTGSGFTNGAWRTFSSASGQYPYDQVLYHAYNLTYDDATTNFVRDDTTQPAIRYAYEANYLGVSEWNADYYSVTNTSIRTFLHYYDWTNRRAGFQFYYPVSVGGGLNEFAAFNASYGWWLQVYGNAMVTGVLYSTALTATSGTSYVTFPPTNATAAAGVGYPLLLGNTNSGSTHFSKLDAANIAAGSTFPAINAANLTNLPAAMTTAGVNSIIVDVTNTLIGNIDFDDSVEIDPYQNGSNGVSWQINSGSIASSKLAAAVISWVGSKGTGSVGVAASFGVTNTAAGVPSGTWPNINIGTNDSQGSATGNLFRVESQHANLIVTTNNGPTARFTLSGVALGSGSRTNLPTYLVANAGNTVTVNHADNLFSTTATTTPWTVTVDLSVLGTGEVWTALLEVNAGTNSVAFPTNTINNIGRASSTNLQISTTIRTEILLQKPLGSPIVYPVQLTP